jgi:hypothetical protein
MSDEESYEYEYDDDEMDEGNNFDYTDDEEQANEGEVALGTFFALCCLVRNTAKFISSFLQNDAGCVVFKITKTMGFFFKF